MTVTLGLNISSLKSQRQLARSSDELSNVFTRLSSGQRINRASDDAAGLAIADSLRADSRVFEQGIRNLNDGISVLNIADGAIEQLTNITLRLTELAEQAANGTLGIAQRSSLNEEAQALKAEYFRISKSTEFNGIKLFDGSYGTLSLQAGYGVEAQISDGLGGAIGDGTFADARTFALSSNLQAIADINGDGFIDLVTSRNVSLGNGDGTFGTAISYSIAGYGAISVEDLDGDGKLDILGNSGLTLRWFKGNGDGTFNAEISLDSTLTHNDTIAGDFNRDGHADFLSIDATADVISVFQGNGDGTFSNISSVSSSNLNFVSLGDFDGDGVLDFGATSSSGNSLTIFYGGGDGSFMAGATVSVTSPTNFSAKDINNDGHDDLVILRSAQEVIEVRLSNGDGTFQSGLTSSVGAAPGYFDVGDLNGDGILDVVTTDYDDLTVSVLIGNGDGTFKPRATYDTSGAPNQMFLGDVTTDGVLDILSFSGDSGNIDIYNANTVDGVAPLLDFSLGSSRGARDALNQFKQKLDQLIEQRGQIGAFQSRIDVAEKVLKVSSENFRAAESRIRDADIAQESSQLTRLNILQQSAAAVLGQANLQPQLVLQLLGGGR